MLPSLTPSQTSMRAAAEELGGVGRRSQVRLGDDFDQRHAAAVEVDVACAIGIGNPSCSDLPASSSMWTRVMPTRVGRRATRSDRRRSRAALVLRDLIALRQVGIEVVLAREDRRRWIVQPSASAARIA
jgi:hypothetical protein